MKNITVNKKEIDKFSKLASEWWNPDGKFKPLHKFNPIRIKYIRDSLIKINKKSNGRCGGTSNLFFKKGSKTFNELINSRKKILYINETIGHGTNLITGDYSVGASGQIIENGEFKYPVSEITIAGNFNEIFKNLILADDLALNYSTNSPTMLVEGITVGGI